jgi:D-alanyl-D-alanine carboxypeptidase
MSVRSLPALVLLATLLAPTSARAQIGSDGRIPPANPDLLVPPEQIPPSPDSPIVGLTAVLEHLNRILATIDPHRKSGRLKLEGETVPLRVADDLAAARRHTESALHAFLGTNLGLRRTAAGVELAIKSLQAAPVRRGSLGDQVLKALSFRLAVVSREIGRNLVERARDGGVPPQIVFRRLQDLLIGDRLLVTGNYGGAAGHYGESIAIGDQLQFDLDRFQVNVLLAFENQSVGYSYAIAVEGQLQRFGAGGLGDDGFARTSADPPETPQSPTKEMNIASISKSITAVALLRLMEANGVEPDDSISPYLPPSWTQGPCIQEGECSSALTFRDLMTHRSGLDSNNNGVYDYASLQSYVAQGVNPALKTFTYQNSNFALLARVVLPMVLGFDPEDSPDPAFAASALYRLFVAGVLLQPIGVDADCLPDDPNRTFLYRFPYSNTAGRDPGDWTPFCGSGGWYFSAVELLNFFAHVRYDDAFLSPSSRQAMDFGFLGWMSPLDYGFVTGTFGTYRGHGGDLGVDPATDNGADTCAMNFPEDVQAVVLINSHGGAYPYQCAALKQAYEDAWIYPE